MSQKNLWILVGLPGSGKSYWAKNYKKEDTAYVSRDEIRFSFLKNGEEYFKHERMVYSKFLSEIQSHLDNGEDVIADATHLNWASRDKLLRHLNLEDVKVNCIVFKTPLNLCLERNAQREGRARVPDDVIKNMNNSFTHPSRDPYLYNIIRNIYADGADMVVVNNEGVK